MSDYVANLIQRETGAPSLRPITPAVYFPRHDHSVVEQSFDEKRMMANETAPPATGHNDKFTPPITPRLFPARAVVETMPERAPREIAPGMITGEVEPMPPTFLPAAAPSRKSPMRGKNSITPRLKPVVLPGTRPQNFPMVDARNSSAEITIRVSIGRIEVRAITPPAATPRKTAAPARPKMSLEDYLRQREGGMR